MRRARWQIGLGVLVGLIAGATIRVGFAHVARVGNGPMLSESDGHLQSLVIHYERSARTVVGRAYHDFLTRLAGDVTVYVVCPTADEFDELTGFVGQTDCHLQPVIVGHPVTTWARDRWLALQPRRPQAAVTLYRPRGEMGADVWPARAGDERVVFDLAAAVPGVRARISPLLFEGGDWLADEETVFLMPRVLPRNIQITVESEAEFLQLAALELGRRVVLLDQAPDHHAAMILMSVGSKTMVVGDPALARSTADDFSGLPGGPDFSDQTQAKFDAVAGQCAAAGYRIVRVPVVPARDGRTYLTYVNVILDQQGDHRVVYLPCYRGFESLNRAAQHVWEGLGYRVCAVDCSEVYPQFGSLHCLVNVLRRS